MRDICQAIIDGYAAGKCGFDDDMIQHLVDLGDQAEGIIAMEDEIATLRDALRAAVAYVELFTGNGCREQPPEWARLPDGDFDAEEIAKRGRAALLS